MEPSPRAMAGRNGDAQCVAASVSESGYEGRWSVECLEGDVCVPVSQHRQTTHLHIKKEDLRKNDCPNTLFALCHLCVETVSFLCLVVAI